VKFLSSHIDSKVQALALEINQLIKESHQYQEYLSFIEAMDKNLQLDEANLASLRQDIVNKTFLDSEDLEYLRNKYKTDTINFLENDFVKAYHNAYEEYSELIYSIKEQLERII